PAPVGPGGQLVEHAVVVDQQPLVLGLADPWPLGLPFVIEGVGGLRQPVTGPAPVPRGEHLQDRGGLVPAGGEDRVGELPAAADRRERLVGDDPPGGPVVLGQTSAALLARPIVLSVLVRADDQASVGAVAVLVVDFPLSLRG